jgi:hypothetical protein
MLVTLEKYAFGATQITAKKERKVEKIKSEEGD